MEIKFKKGDGVIKGDKNGVVIRVSDKAVHVRYDNDFFEKFHFNPTHHSQTPIKELEIKQK